MVARQKSTYSPIAAEERKQEILLAPYFLLRVTGLPFSIMEQLQFPRTVAIIEEIIELEGRYEQQKEPLLDSLKAHFKQVPDKEIQHKGLDLQRAIMSQNGQKALRLLQIVMPALPEKLGQETEAWVRYSLRHAELLAQGEPTLQEELIENRKKLRAWFTREDFQQGLLLSSETLSTELRHYLDAPPEKSNNRLRKAEEGLLSYFVRMATKTSPYSTFCSTSLGTWNTQAETQPDQLTVQSWQKQRHVRFHAGLLATMAHHLAARPEVRPYLYPVVNTTLNWVSEHPVTQQPAAGTEQTQEIEKIEIFLQEKVKESKYIYQERLVRIRINALARKLITAIEQAAGTRTYQEIVEQVAETLLDTEGVLADSEEWQKQRAQYQEKTRGMLEYLARYAVIAVDLRIPAHEDDKLTFLIERLAAIPGAWLAGIRESFGQIRALMESYAYAPAQECARILPALRDLILQLCQEIGSQDDSWDARKLIERLYPALILEDSTLPFSALTLDQGNWQPVLQDLQLLQEIAPVLDLGVITKLNMDHWAREAFAQRPSQTEDLITCHLRFWQEFMSNYELQQQWLRSDPHFIQLRQFQHTFLTLLRSAMQQARETQTRVARLDVQELREFTRHLPDFLRQRAALAHFGQFFFDQAAQPQMVLNATWTGPGTAFSRFSHLFQQLSSTSAEQQAHAPKTPDFVETFRAYVTQLGRHHDAVYASIAETGDINVNMHAALAPYEILFPMSASHRAREEQITLRDLHVHFHQQKQEYQIYSQRLNERVLPVHMGFSLLQMLPPLYQAIVTTTTHYPLFDLITLLESQLTPAEKQQPRHYPRIALGHIILNRESWKIPAALVPQREANETSFDYFLKMNRWRVANELPMAGFRRIAADASENPPLPGFVKPTGQPEKTPAEEVEESAGEATEGLEQGKKAKLKVATKRIPNTLSKPFYLHFQNYFLVSLLGTIARNLPEQTTLSLEEILPGPAQHLLKQEDESYTTEFVLEMSRLSAENEQEE